MTEPLDLDRLEQSLLGPHDDHTIIFPHCRVGQFRALIAAARERDALAAELAATQAKLEAAREALEAIADEENVYTGHGDFKTVPYCDADQAQSIARAALESLSTPKASDLGVEGRDPYDFMGAYMSDTKCFMQLDHEGQVRMMKDIADNVGWDVTAPRWGARAAGEGD